MSFKVDFIGIGAAKSGSTWLAGLAEQHPDVAFPRLKETEYFNTYNYDNSFNKRSTYPISYYQNLWDISEGKICGEWSPQYLYDKDAATAIHKHNPEVKLLVVIRNPVKRAYSHYLYNKNYNNTIPGHLSFEEACKEQAHLLDKGLYAQQLKAYFELFSKDQIKIWVMESAVQQPEITAKELYQFLDLKDDFNPDFSKKKNESKRIKNPTINWLLSIPGKLKRGIAKSSIGSKLIHSFEQSKLHQKLFFFKTKLKETNVVAAEKEDLKPSVYNQLLSYFASDMEELEAMGIDTSLWTKIKE